MLTFSIVTEAWGFDPITVILSKRLYTTVAHWGHCFHKEKTLQIKKFLANTNNTSKKSPPAHCKQKRNCKKIHAANKTPAHCKQNYSALQTKLRHAANKTFARCKQNSSTLQTKLLHTANETPARCKQKNYTLQTKVPHTAKKTPARCKQKQKVLRAQGDIKDWDLVSWFSWFMAEFREIHVVVTRTQTRLMFYGHAMFRGNSQKEARYYLSSPVYRCCIDRTVKN